MSQESGKIKSFTDLEAWRKGYNIAIEVYKITKGFPKTEIFGITNQLRRAIISYTSNIAEGFSRNSDKEKIQFYYMALGSMTEIQNQLLIARGIDYINDNDFKQLSSETIFATKLINGLIKSTRARNLHS